MNDCIFCDYESNIDQGRRVFEYMYWRLAIQQPKKLLETKQAAGLLISRRHFIEFSDATDEEVSEFRTIIKDAAERLCDRAKVTYIGQETVGFNQVSDAGQTVFHSHIHILPVAQEDSEELKNRGGIGGAFEALRRERLER